MDNIKFDGSGIDFYGEYTLTLPYEWQAIKGSADEYLPSLSLEQQQQKLKEAGYSAEIFSNYYGDMLFIVVHKNDKAYYFEILALVSELGQIHYKLSNLVLPLDSVIDGEMVIYEIFFPNQFIKEIEWDDANKEYSFVIDVLWNEFASFYMSTKQNYPTVDSLAQKVQFDNAFWIQLPSDKGIIFDTNSKLVVTLNYDVVDEHSSKINIKTILQT
ncbi:MAG: hypothetical protein LBU60_05380 [Clostridiales bacterium]|nr:hypothetical protein [Clostridiales bacterium]